MMTMPATRFRLVSTILLTSALAACGGGSDSGGGTTSSVSIQNAAVEDASTGERSSLALGGVDRSIKFSWAVAYENASSAYTMTVFMGTDSDPYAKKLFETACADGAPDLYNCERTAQYFCSVLDNSLLCGTTSAPRNFHITSTYTRFTFKACMENSQDCTETVSSTRIQPGTATPIDYSAPEAALRMPSPGNPALDAEVTPPATPSADPGEEPDVGVPRG